MKRMEKVIGSLSGVKLFKNDGTEFTFALEDVVDITNKTIEGKRYASIKLRNGYEILHRNTAQCTFYEIIEGEPTIETAEEPSIDLNTITFTLEDSVEINDFYSKKFTKLLTIENEENICFGFLEDITNLIYIPMGTSMLDNEMCCIRKLSELEDIITEEEEIEGNLVLLNRSKRHFDKNNYILECDTADKKYRINKIDCDKVIKVNYKDNLKIAFVKDDKIILPLEIKTDFFDILTIKEVDFHESLVVEVLYKKYIKQKSTSGITDIDYTDMFSYLKF